jgi:hypothetical protein
MTVWLMTEAKINPPPVVTASPKAGTEKLFGKDLSGNDSRAVRDSKLELVIEL